MNTVTATPLSNNTSRAYAGHYSLSDIKKPRLANVIGRDGQDAGQQSNPDIHVNINSGPYEAKDPRRVHRMKRFSHLFVNTRIALHITPSTATTMFPLEELNYRLHEWKLQREERVIKHARGANNQWTEEKEKKYRESDEGKKDPPIDIDYVRNFITYMGVLNTDRNAPARFGNQKMVSVIVQGNTNIPNSFEKDGVFTKWNLFFMVKEKCLTMGEKYCYDEYVGELNLRAPGDKLIVRIKYLATPKSEIPILCPHCKITPKTGMFINRDCKHNDEILAYNFPANTDEQTAMNNNFIREVVTPKFVEYLNNNPTEKTAYDAMSTTNQFTYFNDWVTKATDPDLNRPSEWFTTKQGYAIPFARVEYNDYRNQGTLLLNSETDIRQYQKNRPLKVWMHATNQ